jgi:hypothetical protein
MKAEAVHRSRIPVYPTRRQLLADPAILERHQPPLWRATDEIAKAVTLFLAANLAGCGGGDAGRDAGGGKSAAKSLDGLRSAPAPVATIVAPIFEHGEGRGGIGCVAVSPPVFLSEEEAMRVIQEEIGRSGVELTRRRDTWADVAIPTRWEQWDSPSQTLGGKIGDFLKTQVFEPLGMNGVENSVTHWLGGNRPSQQRIVVNADKTNSLVVSGLDPKRKIGVRFVNFNEYEKLGGLGLPPGYMSTATGYDFKETAYWVAKQVREQSKSGFYFGAFYDSMSHVNLPAAQDEKDPEKRWRAIGQACREDSLRLLRAQVKDFVDWLKAQGAL